MGLFWILFVASTAIISVQTTDISTLYNVTAFEGAYPRLQWTYASSYIRIDWYHGDTSTTPILTYINSTGENTYTSDVQFITDVTNSVGIILNAVTRSSSGLYSVKVTGSDGTISQSSTYLNVIQGEYIITIKINNQIVTPGESLQTGPTQLDVTHTALGNMSVNCSYNGVDCGGCTNILQSQQCTLNINLENEGTLSLTITITGIEGEYHVDFPVEDVQEPKSDMNTTIVRQTVDVGQYFATNCTVVGEPSPYVQWWYNVSADNESTEITQQFVSNASIEKTTLTIDNLSPDDITTYYCKASYLDITNDRIVTLVLVFDGNDLDGNGLEPWLIAVIVVVVLVTCVILIVIIVLIIKKKSQTSKGQRAAMNYAVYR